jgi:D-aspartate ligase
MQSNYSDSTGVIVPAGITANSLGVIRGFGRRGIPVVYIESEPCYMGGYSRYISRRLKCPSLRESETGFINVLLDFGKQLDSKMVIIPTGDREVLALSRYKKELGEFYHLPLPSYEVVQKLVNKRIFYKLLAKMQFPHPRTYFPANTAELAFMGREIDYPYIIKPAYSPTFQEEFHKKCLVINSSQELDRAVRSLSGKDLEFVIQEIIPGREIYELYTYFNKKSEPLALCGWDKVRHYPPDFGSGSFCRSRWRPSAVEPGVRLLKAIGYYGLASTEVKKDPRDGKYKLLEINARTTLQNRLAEACGVDITHKAYLEASGQMVKNSPSPRNGVLWVDDFLDQLSCLILLKRRETSIGEVVKSIRARKVHSVAAWDDPVPLFARAYQLGFSALRLCLSAGQRLVEESSASP